MIARLPALRFLSTALLLFHLLAGPAPSQTNPEPTPAQALSTDPRDNLTDWSIYRGDKKALQFSTLDQITTENVHQLAVAWQYHHGEPVGPSMYSNGIVVDGLYYFTTPTLNAVALDAATGEMRWIFHSREHHPRQQQLHGRNRGVVYWEDAEGAHGRIFHFVHHWLYALDARTGSLITSFGQDGVLDLRNHLPVPPSQASVEVTTPGITYRNLLIVGSRVPEGNASTPGDIRAFDALTGAFRWIFHTIPHPGEPGYETWSWEEGVTYGGANPWGGFSLDEERGWVFCATGSAAGDFVYGGNRKGLNLYANCVLALDAETGERQWHFQTVHHDIFDYDNPPAPILARVGPPGEERDVAVQLTKMGLTFVLDRQSGQPVFPIEERPVPSSTVEGEVAWPTQPFPVKPPPLVRLGTYEADLTNITPEARAHALDTFRRHRTGGLYTPASLAGTITTPGHQGGVEWGGAAFDPETDVLYVNANEAPTINQLLPLPHQDPSDTPAERGRLLYQTHCTFCHGPDRQGVPPLFPPLASLSLEGEQIRQVLENGRGIMPAFAHLGQPSLEALEAYLKSEPSVPPSPPNLPTEDSQVPPEPARSPHYLQHAPFFVDDRGYPAIAPPWGTLNAIDLRRGEILWKVPLGEYPELAAEGIRHTGAKNFGGPVLTAGNIIFIAATPDEKIRAFDKRNGQVLWEHPLPAGGYATPSIYQIAGRQFVVIAAGGGGKLGSRHGDAIVAFALPN